MMVWAQSAGGGGRGWRGQESGSGLGVLEGAGSAGVQEWEWPGSAGVAADFAGGGWECRSGSGLIVLELLEGRSLEIYVHINTC